MKFGAVPVNEAEGGLLAHQVRAGDLVLRKSHRVSAADCAMLAAAGLSEIVIARLEAGDLDEDEAATRLGTAALGAHLRADPAATGRVNLFAEVAGLFLPDAGSIDAFNALDPAMFAGIVEAIDWAHAQNIGPVIAGGHSYGGRMTSVVVGEGTPVDVLTLFSYPLHPPGKPERLRTEHFAAITSPTVFTQGTADPFGTIDELRTAVRAIPAPVQIVEITGARHDLGSKTLDVPALAVDRHGHRLGRGAGFYDRSLPLCDPGAALMAVVRDDELLDAVPSEAHDVAMTHALTPRGGVVRLG